MKHAMKHILAMVLVFGLVSWAGAQDKRYAILVGAGDYTDASILKLKTPANDVDDLARALTASGWDRVFAMKDNLDYRNQDFPSRTNIEKKVGLLADLAKPQDTILIFLSGHGVAEGSAQYFLPVDADLQRVRETSVAVDSLVERFRSRGINNVVLVVDACRESLSATKGIGLVGIGGTSGAKDQGSRGPALSLYATQSGWYSFEDPNGRNGVFTRFLIEGLAGKADGSGSPKDGTVTFGELARWLPEAVTAYALDTGIRQKPVASAPAASLEARPLAKAGAIPMPQAPSPSAPSPAAPPTMAPATAENAVLSPEQAKEIGMPDTSKMTQAQKLKLSREYLTKLKEAVADGDGREAWALLLGAEALDPQVRSDKAPRKLVVDALENEAWDLMNDEDPDGVFELLDPILPYLPNAGKLFAIRATAWQSLEQHDRAIRDLLTARAQGYKNVSGDLALADNHEALEDYAEAEKWYKSALEQKGDEEWYAWYEYGGFLLDRGRYQESRTAYDRSLALKESAETRLMRVYLFQAMGNKDQAKKEAALAKKLAQEGDVEWVLEDLKQQGY